MNKYDYLMFALTQRLYQKKSWLISAFSIITGTQNNLSKLNSYCVMRDEEKKTYYFYDHTDRVDLDSDFTKPLFDVNEIVTLKPGFHPFITEEIKTTIGVILLNFSLVWEPFKGNVPYHNGEFTGKVLKKIINQQMVDNPKPGETVPEGKNSVNDCLRVSNQADFLSSCCDLFVKTAGIDALTVEKEVTDLRDKLIAECSPEQLKDPIIVANIIDQVVALDMAIQMNGPSKEFFIEKGLVDNARKKMFLVFGMEQDFVTGEYVFIQKPLIDGWDPNYLPLYINTAVTAAYDRGKDTADGGARVKEIIRHTSNILLTEDDCDTEHTEDVKLTKDIFKDWIGGYHMVKGKPVVITEADTNLIDKVVKMRVPNLCATPNDNYCKVCCGDKLSQNPSGLCFETFHIGTIFMLLSMKSAHVSQLHTATINPEIAFC